MALSPSVVGLLVGSLTVLLAVFAFGGWLLGQCRLARRRGTWSPLTEELLRVPGHSLRLETDALQDDLLGCYLQFVAMAVFIVAAWLLHDDPHVRWTVVAMAGALMLRALWRAPKLLERLRRVTLGRECEEYVGQELNLLMRDGAFVFHDIPYRYGNIDHVVVGHDRVLVVETKGRRKPRSASGERAREARVRFDGRTLSFPGYDTAEPLEQVRRHAAHVREAIRHRCGIDCPVIPVVAIPGWFIDAAPYEEGGVLVVNARRAKALRPWLGRREGRARTASVAHYLNSLARTVAPHSRVATRTRPICPTGRRERASRHRGSHGGTAGGADVVFARAAEARTRWARPDGPDAADPDRDAIGRVPDPRPVSPVNPRRLARLHGIADRVPCPLDAIRRGNHVAEHLLGECGIDVSRVPLALQAQVIDRAAVHDDGEPLPGPPRPDPARADDPVPRGTFTGSNGAPRRASVAPDRNVRRSMIPHPIRHRPEAAADVQDRLGSGDGPGRPDEHRPARGAGRGSMASVERGGRPAAGAGARPGTTRARAGSSSARRPGRGHAPDRPGRASGHVSSSPWSVPVPSVP